MHKTWEPQKLVGLSMETECCSKNQVADVNILENKVPTGSYLKKGLSRDRPDVWCACKMKKRPNIYSSHVRPPGLSGLMSFKLLN